MKRWVFGFVCLAALSGSLPPAALAQESHDPAPAEALSPAAAEAARVVDGFHAALARNDVPGALAALADDVLIFESGYVERSKSEYASHHAPADAAYAAAVPATLTRRSGGAAGEHAWITSESTAAGSYRDKPVDRVTTETMLLRRDGDGWSIVHVHWSSRPAS